MEGSKIGGYYSLNGVRIHANAKDGENGWDHI